MRCKSPIPKGLQWTNSKETSWSSCARLLMLRWQLWPKDFPEFQQKELWNREPNWSKQCIREVRLFRTPEPPLSCSWSFGGLLKTEMLPPFCPKRPHFHLAVTTAVEAAPRVITIVVLYTKFYATNENVYVISVAPKYIQAYVRMTKFWPFTILSINYRITDHSKF